MGGGYQHLAIRMDVDVFSSHLAVPLEAKGWRAAINMDELDSAGETDLRMLPSVLLAHHYSKGHNTCLALWGGSAARRSNNPA